MLSKHQTDITLQPNYSFQDGLLMYKNKIFIPEKTEFRISLIHEYHSTPNSGHSRVQPTLARILASFSWPGIYIDVK